MACDLKGKVAVLTGAGGGIGRAVAEMLAQEKMNIVLLGGNNPEKLAQTEKIIRQYTDFLTIPGNLTDMDFLTQAVEKAVTRFGGIDVLINNAGVAQNTAFTDISEAEYDRIMAINTKVPFFLCQRALPFLKKSASATIINILIRW